MELPGVFAVACHTKNVGVGTIFVAINGMHQHGINFALEAIEKGASTIVVEHHVPIPHELLTAIETQKIILKRVSNARKALAELSAQAYHYPASGLKMLAVTGTKGKTTSCFLLEHLLRTAGFKTALLSSVYNKIDAYVLKTDLTTPQPDYLHAFFNECVQKNVDLVVMETAAQAETLHRLEGIHFEGVLFTNFDHEHGEFYSSMDDYFAAKCQILERAKAKAPVLVNADDQWCAQLSLSEKQLKTFGFTERASIMGSLQECSDGLDLLVIGKNHEERFYCPTLVGTFNAYNVLASISLLLALNISAQKIQEGLLSFPGVPGRMQLHILPNDVRCYLDKAHNPSSYRAVLQVLRNMTNQLIVVFGAGGERDKAKRPIMGKTAAELSDLIILTSDDPRSEDPQTIMDDILSGIPANQWHKVVQEVDRKVAIRLAYQYAASSAVIAILGKGSDEYQLIDGVKYPFSERDILHELV